jgi:glycosyltransferase involved in cell wall biosynthesis
MRIGFFLPSLVEGGAERVTLTLACAVAARGIQVDLVLGRAEGAYLAEVGPELNVVDLQARNALSKIRALAAYLRLHRPDALLSAEDFVNVAAIAKRVAGAATNVVSGVHNNMSNLLHSQSGWKARLRPFVFQSTLPLADRVVCVSRGVAEDIAGTTRVPRERIHVIYNPLPFERIRAQARERIEHPFFATGAPPVFLGIGRLTRQKDFANLIRAFAILRTQMPARLLILGTGDLLDELKLLAADLSVAQDVSFAGFVANPYAFMAKSAALVVSSLFEGLSTVLIEGLACGTRVVSTDCPSGPREILENEKLGRLVPVADPAALAHAMRQCLLETTTPAAVAESLERFSTDRIVGQYLDVLSRNSRPTGMYESRDTVWKEAL